MGAFFGWLLSLAPVWGPKVLGWFGIKVPAGPESDTQIGERLGKAETNADISKKELEDAEKALDAGRAADADNDAGGVRRPREGDRKWDPDVID